MRKGSDLSKVRIIIMTTRETGGLL